MRRSWPITFIALALALSVSPALAQRVDYDRGAPARSFHLRGLVPSVVYRVVQDGAPIRRATGAQLASAGIRVALDAEWRSSVIEIDAQR